MGMRVAVLTATGKAGKSTLANNLLVPRMPNAIYIQLETINLSGVNDATEALKLKGREIDKLQNRLVNCDSAVIDVGASNFESFMLGLTQQDGAHLDFDYFLVPIEANSSKLLEIDEAIITINALSALGVEPERIKVVFNKLAADSDVEEEAKKIFNFHRKEKKFTLNRNATIHDTPAFKSLGEVKKTYGEMLADKNDYRAILKGIPIENSTERLAIVKLMRAQGCVNTIRHEFDNVFLELFGS